MPREKLSNLKQQETTYLNTAWLPHINGMFKSKGIRLSDLKNMLINVTPCTAYSLPYDLNMSTAKSPVDRVEPVCPSVRQHVMRGQSGLYTEQKQPPHTQLQYNAAQGPVH